MGCDDTLLIASILCRSQEQTIGEVEQALQRGADLVELRIDGMEDAEDAVNAVFDAVPPDRVVLTCRSQQEGGLHGGNAESRAALLRRLMGSRLCGIDVEYADWVGSARPREILASVLDQPEGDTGICRLILSAHGFSGQRGELAAWVRALIRASAAGICPGVAKIAWVAADVRDNLHAFDLMRRGEGPIVAICMGAAGLPSRILGRKFGAFATYCAASADSPAAPGQLSLDEMVELYRWPSIAADTRVFGLLGNPVAHSQGPRLHNAWLAQSDIDAVYVPFLVGGKAGSLVEFLSGCLERPWLDIGGFSVTVPNKTHALAFVQNRIEPLASRIGAVNTLTRTAGGFHGHNTDYAGALDALTDALGCERSDLAGTRVEVLGAGGVARAVVAGLSDCGARVSVANRTAGRADDLLRNFECAAVGWDDRARDQGIEILVNCTSVGMWPDIDVSPVPMERLRPKMVVFDSVYNPLETRLLREAAAAGCRAVDGLSMFIHQAAAQYRIWFEQSPDTRFARKLLQAHLKNGAGVSSMNHGYQAGATRGE